jgi:hypothetical protein
MNPVPFQGFQFNICIMKKNIDRIKSTPKFPPGSGIESADELIDIILKAWIGKGKVYTKKCLNVLTLPFSETFTARFKYEGVQEQVECAVIEDRYEREIVDQAGEEGTRRGEL